MLLFLVHCTLHFPTIKFESFCVVWATINIKRFLINSKYELFMCYIHQSESTSILGTNDIICGAIWRHLSLLPCQFSIFDDMGGWQPCECMFTLNNLHRNLPYNKQLTVDLYNYMYSGCIRYMYLSLFFLQPTGQLASLGSLKNERIPKLHHYTFELCFLNIQCISSSPNVEMRHNINYFRLIKFFEKNKIKNSSKSTLLQEQKRIFQWLLQIVMESPGTHLVKIMSPS